MKVKKLNYPSKRLTLTDASDIVTIVNALAMFVPEEISILKYCLRKKSEHLEHSERLISKIRNLIQVLDDLIDGCDLSTDTNKFKEELEKAISSGGAENE